MVNEHGKGCGAHTLGSLHLVVNVRPPECVSPRVLYKEDWHVVRSLSNLEREAVYPFG